MNKKLFTIATTTLLLLLLAGCTYSGQSPTPINPPGGNTSGGNATGKTVTFNILAKKSYFEPKVLTVNKWDSVVINITAVDAAHGFALSEYGVNETLKQGETKQVNFVANKVGTFTFRCTVPCGPDHLNMIGQLIVAEPSQTPAPADTSKVLDLSGKGLTKLPDSVLKMTNLEELNLSDNNLSGALPAEIRFLTKLKTLNLANNLMTGVPAEVGQLTYLETLDLSFNKFTGLPNEIANLKNLKVLNLTGNNYSKQDLQGIKNALPNLKVIGETL